MYEYPARIKLTSKMAGNGDVYSKTFNGKCTVGINRRKRGTINKRAEDYLKAVSKSLGEPAEVMCVQKPGRAGLPQLEVVSRVAAIPIVESGIGVAERIYFRIRDSNPLIRWYLSVGERSLSTGVQMALPAVQLLETPIQQLDKFLCKSLDVVEKRVPSIYLPPQMMYSETREYVLRRADSVKQLGTAVLDSRMTAVTATALERALTTADKYVDKYLPPDYQDAADVVIIVTSAEGEGGEVGGSCEESGRACAAQAVQRGARLRRKLQRRLTRQALAEAKAIKEQIHVLVYVAELIATDPALAWKKAKQLYASLSCPEPENQARPATLEELVVLLARETARKVVHLVNYTHTDLPNNMRQGMSLVSKHLSSAANALLKALPVDSAISEVRNWRSKVQALLQQLQETSKTYLEHLAIFLAGNEEREKITPRSTYAHRDDLAAFNGVN
ncbi:PREDICTED: lipid storage droplets surface-binding protein 1 isoform X1 [Papilio xuthus]|uniref:Lipid storage droplets surface-binding protein 1 isoform X1 n=1 Tax=Papilio xuthus TaxID=66420 RepID=A0AAJ6Z8T9_PAPXU|nr:PREDICTED: lipid storage droplets surface-binding protein 1 isoform X1 [Papilio xuthus]